MKIAIQGGKASFHDIAAHSYFDEEIEVLENETFKGVCEQVVNGEADLGLMAIENSIAGSILLNYSLIEQFGLNIIGEYKLRIKHNLMALPGQKLEDMKLVRSHYMALLQCKEFLDEHPGIVVEEYYDTADAAKYLVENNALGEAAIAGERAAEMYGLEILAPSVETIKLNFTRFFVVSKSGHSFKRSDLNKCTLSFKLSHEVGALAKSLQVIVDHEVNLTKIQSVPIIGQPDQYTFYLDCIYKDYADMLRCYNEMEPYVKEAKVLGEYINHEINYGV